MNNYQNLDSETRPWGRWSVIAAGQRFVVKQIVVKPGGRISLQRHRWRDEHWVVVEGTAEIVIDGETRSLGENDSIFISAGSTHRLGNPGTDDLTVIEIQYGQRLEEGDIERLEDQYGRS